MQGTRIQISGPAITQTLFTDSRVGWLWLPLRLYIGWEWLQAGWEKYINPAWVGEKAGTAVSGFFNGALAKTTGAHPDVSGWYAAFLQYVAIPHPVFFSYFVTFGEIAVGLGLIAGALTGAAAFFGMVMNFSFLFAGTVSINPLLLLAEIFLVLAWRNAGWIGLDRFIFASLGVPWIPSTWRKNQL